MLEMAPSRLYRNSPVFGKVYGKNRENSGENLDLSLFFQGFSSPDFAKISAAVLRIFLVRSRAPETNIWPISSFFSFFWHQKYETPTFSFYFEKNRPWNHAQDLDLAICYTEKTITTLYDQIWPTWWQKKVATFTETPNQAYTSQKTRFDFWESPTGKKENQNFLCSFIFLSFFIKN